MHAGTMARGVIDVDYLLIGTATVHDLVSLVENMPSQETR